MAPHRPATPRRATGRLLVCEGAAALDGAMTPTDAFRRHAQRDLPRYTSYPTAVAFHDGIGPRQAAEWAASLDPDQPISVYVHTPFCDQLCWYCGCHTTVPNGYARVEAFARRLEREIDGWAAALGAHAGAKWVHFGGGSPNSLNPADFAAVLERIRDRFAVRADAEIAVELDPRSLTHAFVEGLGRGGVNRASLGVQTFDREVQAKVNRVQPFEMVAESVRALREAGVAGINFDLMYGLPGQTVDSVARSAALAAELGPDRLAVFGYAHVPWFKKHQTVIREDELAGIDERWAMAETADAVLTAAGYVRVGLDHYARAGDEMAVAAAEGRLRRNFQGYTTDAAETLVPLGPSSIGQFRQGYVQNAKSTAVWGAAADAGVLSTERGLSLTDDDRLRRAAIERLMCDLTVDAGAVALDHGRPVDALDDAVRAARALEPDGLCRVQGRRITVPAEARRLMRVTAACFDARLVPAGEKRHAKAI